MSKAIIFSLFVLPLMTIVVPCSSAKNFATIHYTVEDGLPSNNVYRIYKDHQGFLWFATNKGIARYNGIKFQTFTTSDGLPDNEIFFFQEDYQNRLWMSTYNGELCYYKNGIFHSAINTHFLRLSFKASHIIDIHLEKDSSIIISYYGGLRFINISGEKIRDFNIEEVNKEQLPEMFRHVTKISQNQYNILYSNGGICLIDSNCNIIRVRKGKEEDSYKFIKSYEQEYLFRNNCFYTMTENPFYTFKGYEAYNIYNFFYDNGNFFTCTDRGLYINADHLLQNERVSSVLRDLTGNYWVSSLNDGVFILNNDLLAIKEYKAAYQGNIVYSHANNDYLFFATANNNLYRYQNGKSTCLIKYKAHKRTSYEYADVPIYLIDSPQCYNLYRNISYVITKLFNTHPQIHAFNLAASDIKKILATPQLLYVTTSTKILFTARSHFLNNGGRILFKSIKEDIHLTGERIFATAKDSSNNLWFSTIAGVYKVVNDSAIIQPQFNNLSFKWFEIYGSYLIGCTHRNKLVVCHNFNNNISIESVTAADCIWENLYKVDDQHILVSTNKHYRLLTFHPSNVKPSIKILENEFIPINAESICSDGIVCHFFKSGTITDVKIESFLTKPAPPKLFLSSITADKKNIIADSNVVIPYDDSRKKIVIKFSALSFNSKNIFYECSVSKDSIDNWTSLPTEEVNLFSPNYGKYFIKIRAKSLSSGYCDPINLSLTITRPYWARWWFLLLISLLSLSISFIALLLFIRRRFQKIKRENELKIKVLKSDYKALNALMNPHFIFNCLNNIQGLINQNNRRAANEYLRIFSDLVRQNMHNISLELIPLQKEIDLIINYLKLEKLRFSDWLNYTITIDPNIEMDSIYIPPLLIQPLVENALKHGLIPKQSNDNIIRIDIYEQDDQIHVRIYDNGIGIAQAQEKSNLTHQSFGLKNIQKRIEYLAAIYHTIVALRIDEVKNTLGETIGTVAMISFSLRE